MNHQYGLRKEICSSHWVELKHEIDLRESDGCSPIRSRVDRQANHLHGGRKQSPTTERTDIKIRRGGKAFGIMGYGYRFDTVGSRHRYCLSPDRWLPIETRRCVARSIREYPSEYNWIFQWIYLQSCVCVVCASWGHEPESWLDLRLLFRFCQRVFRI